jgi:hypothetical protein
MLLIALIVVFSIWGLRVLVEGPPGEPQDYTNADRFLVIAAALLISPGTAALAILLLRRTRHWGAWRVVAWTVASYIAAAAALVWIVYPSIFVRPPR